MHPIFLQVGAITITSYGLAACIGFLLSFFLAARRMGSRGWDPEIAVDLYLVCTVGGVVLTRLFYVVSYPEAFRADPWLIPQVWRGGVTYYGGLIGAFGTAFLYMKKYRYPVGETMDVFSPYLALAHAIGRMGCFFNGCCYGLATSMSWGVVFPQDRLHLARHPTQVYEAAFEFTNFLILNWMWKRGIRGGKVTLTWFSMYAFQRFVLEFFRGDTVTESYLFGTSFGQSTALVMGVIAVVSALSLKPYAPEDLEVLNAPPEEDQPSGE